MDNNEEISLHQIIHDYYGRVLCKPSYHLWKWREPFLGVFIKRWWWAFYFLILLSAAATFMELKAIGQVLSMMLVFPGYIALVFTAHKKNIARREKMKE